MPAGPLVEEGRASTVLVIEARMLTTTALLTHRTAVPQSGLCRRLAPPQLAQAPVAEPVVGGARVTVARALRLQQQDQHQRRRLGPITQAHPDSGEAVVGGPDCRSTSFRRGHPGQSNLGVALALQLLRGEGAAAVVVGMRIALKSTMMIK